LETHYKQEKSGSDCFLALKFFEYEITDNKPIMDQVHEIQMLISKLSDLDIKVPDSLQVGAVLSKLPPSWNEYRKKMLHSTDNYTFEQFQTHLQNDNKPIMDQVHEIQMLISKLSDLDIKVPDSLQVGAVLSKLPPSWNEYRKKMLHSTDNYTFEQFQTHLQNEVQSCMRELQATNSKVNLVIETGLTMT
jgi:hypothetical protein